MKYICIIFFLLITLQPLSAQEDDIVSVVFAAFDQSDYNAANAVIKNLKTSELKKVLETHYELIKNGTWNTDTFKSKDTLSRAYNIHLLNLGIATYIKKGDDISSFEILKESSLLAKQRNDAVLLCQSFKFMLEIYLRYHVVIGDDNYLTIIEDFRKHAYSDEQSEIIDYFEFHKFVRDNYQNPANTTLDSLYKRYIQKTGSNPFYNVRKSEVLNSYHRKISENIDSANFYTLKAKKDVQLLQKGIFEREREKAISVNEANTFNELCEYYQAWEILQTIEIPVEKVEGIYESYPERLLAKYIDFAQSNAYFGLNDSLNAYKYLSSGLLLDQVDQSHISQAQVAELEKKYQNAEQKKELAESKIRSDRNTNMIIGLVVLLVFVSVVALLTRTAMKRKEQLAQKREELANQKREELLRKHELQTVNAMIVGQEKERKRIANDLHDNINSEIVTAKIQLEHLSENITKIENPKKILDLCVTILDDTYHKTRNISHERNSGVMAQKELIPGIKKLAKKASTAYGLTIHVYDHGFESKLSNRIEITIFSIIQELVTNILKHANATEASISLTQHEQELTIIIEDNGVGFDAQQELSTKGMGLSNMHEQLKQINGILKIDSTIGKGTTIVIDIKNDDDT